MISLAVQHKIAINEDVLTAAFFDYLRARPGCEDIRAFLARARPFRSAAPALTFDGWTIELWPDDGPGQPDARIVLRSGSVTVCRIVVEAKLGASKTGTGEVSADRRQGDQLARYLLAEAEAFPGTSTYVLYLTHHAACPSKDLSVSVDVIRGAHRLDLAERLLWLSWREVDIFLCGAPETPIGMDIRKLLRRIAIHRFDGWNLAPMASLDRSDFYQGRRRAPQATNSAYFRPMECLALASKASSWRYKGSRSEYNWPAPWAPTGPAIFHNERCASAEVHEAYFDVSKSLGATTGTHGWNYERYQPNGYVWPTPVSLAGPARFCREEMP